MARINLMKNLQHKPGDQTEKRQSNSIRYYIKLEIKYGITVYGEKKKTQEISFQKLKRFKQ